MKNPSLITLSIIAIVAIIGIILMIKASNIGAGTLGIKEGRAIKMVSEERFVKGGSPEGILIETYPRKGRLDFMGKEPCPKNYRLSTQFAAKQNCIPVQEGMEEYYLGSVCCPVSTY